MTDAKLSPESEAVVNEMLTNWDEAIELLQQRWKKRFSPLPMPPTKQDRADYRAQVAPRRHRGSTRTKSRFKHRGRT